MNRVLLNVPIHDQCEFTGHLHTCLGYARETFSVMVLSPEFGFDVWVQVGETHCWEDVWIYGLICVSFSQSDWIFGFLLFGSATDASLQRICTLCGSPGCGRCRIWSAVGRATRASSIIDGDGGRGANLPFILLCSTGML